MIRLKQLLGSILLAAAPAWGSVSELSGVQVQPRDHSSVVTIRANGPFTHTEYRPTDTLMLIDLAGVSVAKQDSTVHAVTGIGVKSYRVLGYKSANGAEVARLELNLLPGAMVKVNELSDGVTLDVTAPASETRIPSTPSAQGQHTSVVQNITVARGKDGLNIEITGSGPLTARAMKLTGPDRVVLDIPNSVLQGRTREIPVNNGDVKDVRAAHYQSAPPATRIVVDMVAMHDFDVQPAGNKLVLTLKTGASVPASMPHKTEQQVVAAASEPAAAEPVKDQPAVTTPAETQPVKTETAAAQPASASGVQTLTTQLMAPPLPTMDAGKTGEKKAAEHANNRSEMAASHFVTSDPPLVASTNRPLLPASASLSVQPAEVNAALLKKQQQPAQPQASSTAPSTEPAGGCTTGRYTGEPLNLDLKDLDIKDFFRLIHELSGLNVVLDPSVRGVVTIDVTDIPWDQALALVLRNNSLECELQGNVLRIATLDTLKTEADARRAQRDAQALAIPKQTVTRTLNYAHARDVQPIVKKFLSARGDVVPDERSNSLIIEDIPSTLPKIDMLLANLDRKTPEVEIEARVVAATRTFARDIGTQIGFGWGNSATASGGGTGVPSPISIAPAAGTTPAFLTIPGNTSQIPLFSNLGAVGPTSGISISNFSSIYRLDFVLSMAESRGLVKILSRPRITTFNNIKALIKQGQKIPVVTQAQLGGPPTVTYIDSFLRLTVTPQITSDNTIFLDVDVENTTPDFTRVTGTQLNPTLNTQQATTQVLVSDGQTVVIGGVIQTQNNLAIAQVPLLGSIPLLGNLFKHTSINTSTQELIFFITPKIIQT